jgi:exosome complex RNA-binding protein Csl4
MATIQDINSSIISGQFTNEQLDSIVMAVKFARNQLTHKNRGSMVVGSKVKFTSSRNGQTVIGTVQKVNRKFIIVNSGITAWRVPASMLESA